MKLFKISFISFISILIFQSQLYGINLSCDFKKRINTRYFNQILCGDNPNVWGGGVFDICELEESEEYFDWTYKIIIQDKDVLMKFKRSDYHLKTYPDSPKEEIYDLKVEYVDNHIDDKPFVYDNTSINGTENSYLFYLKSSYNSKYTLYFDSLSKKSILTSYHSLIRYNEKDTWFETTLGHCEIVNLNE